VKHKQITHRQTEAHQRQLERDNRTPEEQLALLDERPGQAQKERHRLLTRIEGKSSK